ncbi:hypothetical protein AHAS_Ahas04G0099500 [Arachis hypogaea]
MMHVYPMQAMSARVGLHLAYQHYLGTIGARLNPLIYAQGETVILSSWASPRSTQKQNTILSSWVSPRSIHNKHDLHFVGFSEINTQQTTILSSWVYPRSKIINNFFSDSYLFFNFLSFLYLCLTNIFLPLPKCFMEVIKRF